MSTVPVLVDDLTALREAIREADSGPLPLLPLEDVPRMATMYILQTKSEKEQ
jgi:hypothetical protein